MDGYQFTASLIDSILGLAWPAFAAFAIYLVRKPLQEGMSGLMGRLTSLRVGNAEASFMSDQLDAVEKIEKFAASPEIAATDEDSNAIIQDFLKGLQARDDASAQQDHDEFDRPPPISDQHGRVKYLGTGVWRKFPGVESFRARMIGKRWDLVEEQLRRMDPSPPDGGPPPNILDLLPKLLSNQIIDRITSNLVSRLLLMRDLALDAGGHITPIELIRYGEAIENVLSRLKSQSQRTPFSKKPDEGAPKDDNPKP